ncbi:MAG: type II secretion system F family protein [Planctomycetes bacterium]|nr:type II secretion system F family protein [Planctomycetota bacterium]
MPRFLCRATDSLGAESELTIEADDPAGAVGGLGERKLHLLSLVQTDPADPPEGAGVLHDRVALFAHGLAEMLRLGLPLPAALRGLAKETDSPRFGRDLEEVATQVEGGRTLSDALAARTGRFSPLFVNLIAAGEKTGRLPQLLPLLVRHLNLQASLRQRLFEALLYPVVAFSVIVAIMLVMRGMMLQPFRTVYQQNQWMTLRFPPLPVQWAFFIIDALPVALLCVALLIALVAGLARCPGPRGDLFRQFWEAIADHLPILAAFRRSALTSMTCHALGTLLRGGVPMPQALDLAVEMSDSIRGRQAMSRAREQCRSGIPLSEAFAGVPLFPATLGWILSSGEARGRLVDALIEAAGFFDRESEFRLLLIRTFLPSVAIIGVAVLVFLPAMLSILVPLFGISFGV